MNVYLLVGAARLACVVPHAGCDHVVAPGTCPACGATSLRVRATSAHPSADDRALEGAATSLCCGAPAGTLRVETDTLFGVREDLAVLAHGRARVY